MRLIEALMRVVIFGSAAVQPRLVRLTHTAPDRGFTRWRLHGPRRVRGPACGRLRRRRNRFLRGLRHACADRRPRSKAAGYKQEPGRKAVSDTCRRGLDVARCHRRKQLSTRVPHPTFSHWQQLVPPRPFHQDNGSIAFWRTSVLAVGCPRGTVLCRPQRTIAMGSPSQGLHDRRGGAGHPIR